MFLLIKYTRASKFFHHIIHFLFIVLKHGLLADISAMSSKTQYALQKLNTYLLSSRAQAEEFFPALHIYDASFKNVAMSERGSVINEN